MDTLSALLFPAGHSAIKSSQIAHEWSERAEISTNGKKDLKKPCAKKWDPYNAPPSTRRM
ncbi:hypothetical protein [Intestinirhabdus alba]|jgi:hypothetical protein|uniref:Uncharacterized protein n=1 Tax=Intestinirhabdus alba TaxID=2899544 RepID=A0A6L6IRA4_9ENTR|nr:hypothetical protein [Intestinirhabdus alba]MTH48504.1 hypothetical protein [Intestinirhabdus alba]